MYKVEVKTYRATDSLYVNGRHIASSVKKEYSHKLARRWNNFENLLKACESLIENLELIEQGEGITACQCLEKAPDNITDPPPCN